jgi:hypothetical protein
MKISVVVSYRCLCNFPSTFPLTLWTPPFTSSSSFCPRHWLLSVKIGFERRVACGSHCHANTQRPLYISTISLSTTASSRKRALEGKFADL